MGQKDLSFFLIYTVFNLFYIISVVFTTACNIQ